MSSEVAKNGDYLASVICDVKIVYLLDAVEQFLIGKKAGRWFCHACLLLLLTLAVITSS